MKVVQRLEYTRLSESLADRGIVDAASSQKILEQCATTGELYAELLVRSNLVADWELSRIVCEIFGLPFLPVDVYEPAKGIAKDLDHDFLRRHCLVPLDRIGLVLSVSMPAMVSADVLARLGQQAKATITPLVGSVMANRSWLTANLADGSGPRVATKTPPAGPRPLAATAKPAAAPPLEQVNLVAAPEPMVDPTLPVVQNGDIAAEGDWLSLFDNADQQIQKQIQKKPGKDAA
jgi:hypothetical protein